MSRITELPAPWTACGALRMGKYCLRSSCCACQAFRPYACMPACICCCLCLHLPICSRKSVPCCRFALCYMNLFMCFVLPSFLLSKSRGVDPVQGGGLRSRGDLRICFLLACLLCMLSVSALCLCQLYFLLHRAVVSTRPTLSLPMARGKYCLRSSCCACQAFRPYACMPACICCCLCLHLPICSRKSVPCCRFALCYMNLFMCFVLPSFLLSKSLRRGPSNKS